MTDDPEYTALREQLAEARAENKRLTEMIHGIYADRAREISEHGYRRACELAGERGGVS